MNNYFFISVVSIVWIIITLYVFYIQRKDSNIKSYFLIKFFIILIIIGYLLASIFYII